MDAKVIAAAREEFDRARYEAERTATGEGHAALARHWSSFLVYANRVFALLERGAKAGPAKGWWDGIKRVRREDELLRYVQHARNAAEHGLRRITPRVPAKPVGFSIGPHSVRPLMLPESTCMVPVYDRGVRYNPSTSHLGQPLNVGRPNLGHLPTFVALETGAMEWPEPFRDMAALTIAYLARVLDEAEAFVTA